MLEHWTPTELNDAFARREVVVVDVRTPQEYAFERIQGALLLPLSDFDATALPAQEAKRVVLHCGSGMRSRKAAEACLAAGAGRIAHLEGGFAAWKAAGLPYLATDPATGGPRKAQSADPAAG